MRAWSQALYVENKVLGELIFANVSALRNEPFKKDEVNLLKNLLSAAEKALVAPRPPGDAASAGKGAGGGTGGATASVFAEFLASDDFCREKVFAQQLCDQPAAPAVDSGGGGGGAPQEPAQVILARFQARPELAPFRSAVEAQLAAFVREPLPVEAQRRGWRAHIALARASAGGDPAAADRPPLARALLRRWQHNAPLDSLLETDEIRLTPYSFK